MEPSSHPCKLEEDSRTAFRKQTVDKAELPRLQSSNFLGSFRCLQKRDSDNKSMSMPDLFTPVTLGPGFRRAQSVPIFQGCSCQSTGSAGSKRSDKIFHLLSIHRYSKNDSSSSSSSSNPKRNFSWSSCGRTKKSEPNLDEMVKNMEEFEVFITAMKENPVAYKMIQKHVQKQVVSSCA